MFYLTIPLIWDKYKLFLIFYYFQFYYFTKNCYDEDFFLANYTVFSLA